MRTEDICQIREFAAVDKVIVLQCYVARYRCEYESNSFTMPRSKLLASAVLSNAISYYVRRSISHRAPVGVEE